MKGAEPITFGHWCLAYVEMLLRDADRFASAAERADECPLGAGALAGTPLPMDRQALAESLGFARASANSLDAVSDRDAIAEYLFCASLLLVHLSRLSEDLILYSSDEFAFVELPDELATGSSRMPHKKNPDVLELTRGHAARAIGEVTGMLALLKGLPLAYNKDLQLDKEPMFRLSATLGAILPVISAVIAGLKLDRERMRVAASSDLLLATAAADALATSGVSFRDAHEMVGKAIAAGGSRGNVALQENPTVESALSAKSAFGGTAPERVREAAAKAAERIAQGRQGR
jgi:argininosuccinate lyase